MSTSLESSNAALGDDLRIGPLRLRNRILKAATFEGRCPNALVSDDLIEFHRRLAAGGVAMTTVAYCAVAPEGRTEVDQIYWREEALPGLKRLTEAVHAEGAAVCAQIGHAGPVADESSHKHKALTPMRMFSPLSFSFTKRATEADIQRVIDQHVQAALWAEECGFDAIELHFGHNYFASSFLSPLLNKRKDAYGGSLENRAKVTLGVARAVREAMGDRIAITAKLNMRDGVRGGLEPDESLQVAKWLEKEGLVDALQLTAGSSLLNPMYLFRGGVPLREFARNFRLFLRVGMLLFGRFFLKSYPYEPLYLFELAQRFQRELDLPIILLGGVNSHDEIQTAVDAGFEFVAMGRALLSDPDLPHQILSDRSAQSRCIHCNRCMPTIYRGTHCPVFQTMLPASETKALDA